MSETLSAGTLALFGSMLLAGLAGSLHCLGMCGPLLISFTRALAVGSRGEAPRAELVAVPSGAVGAPARGAPQVSLRLDLLGYHAGRLWTYAVLGFLAGWVGGSLRTTLEVQSWHRAVTVVMASLVLLAGVALLGGLTRTVAPLERLGCSLGAQHGALAPLLRHPSKAARVLLGALMGLIPCGLVYAMLAVVAGFPTPLHAAGGMLALRPRHTTVALRSADRRSAVAEGGSAAWQSHSRCRTDCRESVDDRPSLDVIPRLGALPCPALAP